jgi:hypothetical protein
LLAVVFAIVVAYAVRLAPGALTRGTSRLLALGYAVPGSVLAVGVLLPVGAIDVWLAEFMQREFGIRTGLLLTGTIVALIYAYLVRYFAVAWNGIEPAFARITPNMDAAARGLGAGAMATLLRCMRLLARPAAASTLLVFIDVMKGSGHPRLAALQFRHAGHAHLHAGAGRAARRGGIAIAGDRRGRRPAALDPGARRAPGHRCRTARAGTGSRAGRRAGAPATRRVSSRRGRGASAPPPCSCQSRDRRIRLEGAELTRFFATAPFTAGHSLLPLAK